MEPSDDRHRYAPPTGGDQTMLPGGDVGNPPTPGCPTRREDTPLLSQATEGVTKFNLEFLLAPPPSPEGIARLNAWRTVLHRLGLIGLDPLRYGGVGYGNVSLRGAEPVTIMGAAPLFLISGTQTGGLPLLTEHHYCGVTAFDLASNTLQAAGPTRPSSEALTHAAVYHVNPGATCVLHVHSPEIWRQAGGLGIPMTDASIAYGTPEMAVAVGTLAIGRAHGIIAMHGHEDGILAYSDSVDDTALRLIRMYARALGRGQPE